MQYEKKYLNLLERLVIKSEKLPARKDRTGVGTVAIFGETITHDLKFGFPLLTSKTVLWKKSFGEMLWFLSGDTNIRPLVEQNISIWTDWPLARYRQNVNPNITKKEFEERIVNDLHFAHIYGELGPVYGKQWRRWATVDGREVDQISELIHNIKTDPGSRRLLFTGWNVGELEQMTLPPCHMTYQFFVENGQLSCLLHQRSADLMLGVPFNICGMALLVHMLAAECNLDVGKLIWVGGDIHLYSNHVDAATEQLSRKFDEYYPQLSFEKKPFFEYKTEDFNIIDYYPVGRISAPVAV